MGDCRTTWPQGPYKYLSLKVKGYTLTYRRIHSWVDPKRRSGGLVGDEGREGGGEGDVGGLVWDEHREGMRKEEDVGSGMSVGQSVHGDAAVGLCLSAI
jgi:hypothetical protein